MRPGPSRPTGLRLIVVTIVMITTWSCRDGGSMAPRTTVDSANIQIVTNSAIGLTAAERWSLSSDPVLRIGAGDDPGQMLFRVASVTPLTEGWVAVGSTSPPGVTIFDDTGTRSVSLGGPGDGPGEFETVRSVVEFHADSLAVWDEHRRRVSVFTKDGRYQREVALEGLVMPSLPRGGGPDEPSGWSYLLPSGPDAMTVFAVGFFGPGDGAHRVEAPSHRVDMEGREVSRYGPFAGAETYAGGQIGFLPVPFGNETYAATIADLLVVGTAEVPEARVYGADGALRRIVRWPDHERAVGGPFLSRWEAWLSEQIESMPETVRRDMAEAFEALGYPERFPAYADVVGTDTSEFWVGEYPGQLGLIGLPGEIPASPARNWLVFRIDGSLVATLETPVGFQPHAVREGRVWGVHKNELLVESVHAYALQRGS